MCDHTSEASPRQYEFFLVPTTKLVLMSTLTFGIYQLYWFYKNWVAVRVAEQKPLWCFMRALFSTLTSVLLFQRMLPRDAMWVAFVFFLFSMLGLLPVNWSMLSLLAVLPLIYVQDRVPGAPAIKQRYAPYSTKEKIVLYVFGLLFGLFILELMHSA